MNFNEHYKSLNRNARIRFRNSIISTLSISHSTFYHWLSSGKIPPHRQDQISELLKKPVSELFPEEIKIN